MEKVTAYLVLGPESTGTRLITKTLIVGGCQGEHGDVQTWDNLQFPPPMHPIVFRRSVPHGGEWPNIEQIVGELRKNGYAVHAVVTSRDWHSTVQSQVHVTHVSSEQEAITHLQRAYVHIFANLYTNNVPFTLVTYESITSNNKTVNNLLKSLGLQVLAPATLRSLNLYDGNRKWLN